MIGTQVPLQPQAMHQRQMNKAERHRCQSKCSRQKMSSRNAFTRAEFSLLGQNFLHLSVCSKRLSPYSTTWLLTGIIKEKLIHQKENTEGLTGGAGKSLPISSSPLHFLTKTRMGAGGPQTFSTPLQVAITPPAPSGSSL